MSQIAKVRLFHNADKSKLVHEGLEAAYLYANTGDEIPDTACELYGLVDGDIGGAVSKPKKGTKVGDTENKGDGTGDAAASDGDAAKAGEQGENKGAAQSENKGSAPAADKAAK